MEIKTIIYVILGIVYLVSRVNKAVKKGAKKVNKNNIPPIPITQQHVKEPEQEAPSSFEDSLNEFLNVVNVESDTKPAETTEQKNNIQEKKEVEEVKNESTGYLLDEMGDEHLSLELESRAQQRARINADKVRKKAIEASQITDIVDQEDDFEFDLHDAVIYDAIMNKPYE